MRYRDFLKTQLKNRLPEDIQLPSGFHIVGHVALVHLNSSLQEYASIIGDATLSFDDRIKSVAIRTGPTSGEKRHPDFEVVAGDCNTVTTHIENGVQFRLDPIRITFSGGNKRERINIVKQIKSGEIVVDMFSCVGQFALQIAKSTDALVTAIEINDDAYQFLLDNIRINKLENRVTALLGDCRKVHPINYANRIIMGYLHNTDLYLPHALDTLTQEGGIIHMHIAIQRDILEDTTSRIGEICSRKGFESQIQVRKIKNYSPGVDHVVFDINLGLL
ncbi:class I SAM-dependent methyltransferase family protein [Candidatus Thorarchaeota archaeon]|nr:MAG: class I SAM-dependent methyltransferase family protein [Candidatus Thorarchaeota archaeon]